MIPKTAFLAAIFLFVSNLPARNQSIKKISATAQRTTQSVLATGKWYKIKITHDGIYKLTYDDLKSMGFSDPSAVKIFGNGGTMLPMMNNVARYDDLQENSIYMSLGSDGIFNSGDYILFYGKGPVAWNYNSSSGMFEHSLNLYSSASYYFITTDVGEGKKITLSEAVTGAPDATTTSFDDYDFHERNKYNFLKSGREWFGERLDIASFDTVFTFPKLITSSSVAMKSNVVSRSSGTRTFSFKSNSVTIGYISVSGVILSNSTGQYANERSGYFHFNATGDQVPIQIDYGKSDNSDEGYLDYITLNVRRELSFSGSSLFFRDHTVTGPGKTARYQIDNCNTNTRIWDISDFTHIREIPAQLNGTVLSFTDTADSLKQYVALDPGASFPKPEITGTSNDVGPVTNQNLHGFTSGQLLIVTHPLFLEAADSLAEFHRTKDHLQVVVATTQEIYNEFSSGAPDVSAIRDFAKMLYDRSYGTPNPLRYLLLLGDGSYNNWSHVSGNSNYILTYQSNSSLNASTSYVSDDFYGIMGNQAGGSDNMEAYTLNLGVGRLPAKSADEAMLLYRKIKSYNIARNMNDWRNNIMFVGDDEDSNIHMTQANALADYVRNRYPQFAVKKVLLDAYKQVSTSTGARYPEVNQIITDNLQKGLLIFNYTGHGGEMGMAAEQILMREDIAKLNNTRTLPLFVTATCEFSRFDDLTDNDGTLLESTSAGETSLLNSHGGSIALFSTTRIVYSDQNYYLNSWFYHVIFQRDSTGHYYRLGDVIRMTKDSTGVQQNKLNFILLGDPVLTLAIPDYTVCTDSLNGDSVNASSDTLKAFSQVTVSGHLEDMEHHVLQTYNGILYPSVFDKALTITTLANDGGDPMQFQTQENLLFKGEASVKNGRFTFRFRIPKDITYSYGSGKIVYYAQDSLEDCNGYFNQFILGGTSAEAGQDDQGPDIRLYLNDDLFADKGITDPNPVIYAEIADSSGINMVGNGIGHDITGVLDDEVSDPLVLNDFFQTDLDDYKRGTLRYPLYALSTGIHTLRVKVWDVFNNSSESSITFRVIDSKSPVLADVYNYPNPASQITWFRFEHNRPGTELTVDIEIFDMQGNLMARLHQNILNDGFSSGPLEWDLKDPNGNPVRQGVYPYRVRITDPDGRYANSYKKLIVLRQ